MVKRKYKIIIFIVILLLSLSSLLILYQEDISLKLTENLNRNLEKNWGKDHPKFIKYNLKVDFLELSASWDKFNILTPVFPKGHVINSIKNIDSSNCTIDVSLALKINLDAVCEEIRVGIGLYEWELFQNLNISKSHFISFGYDRNIFVDLYGKQGNHIVTLNTNNLYINNTNHGSYRIEYYFQDEDTMRININKSDFTLKRQKEGLKISTPYSNFFILNQNYFEYRRRLNVDGA
tara:strand:- start:563 stop:1267 length:705 start_codon:yes stop_codon:yes gene_type:complete